MQREREKVRESEGEECGERWRENESERASERASERQSERARERERKKKKERGKGARSCSVSRASDPRSTGPGFDIRAGHLLVFSDPTYPALSEARCAAATTLRAEWCS